MLGVSAAAGLAQFIVLFLWAQRPATGLYLRTYGPGVARGDQSAASLLDLTAGKEGEGDGDETKSEELTASVRATFSRLIGLAYPERCLLCAGTIALFGSSSMQMISPMLFGKLTQIVSPTAFCKAGDASKAKGGQCVIDEAALDSALNVVGAELAFVFILSAIFTFFRAYLFTLAGERLVARIRKMTFSAVLAQVCFVLFCFVLFCFVVFCCLL